MADLFSTNKGKKSEQSVPKNSPEQREQAGNSSRNSIPAVSPVKRKMKTDHESSFGKKVSK